MKSKKLTGILIAAVIILLVCVVGTTFAYYFAVLRGKNENTISTSKATLILTEQENANSKIKILSEEDGPLSGETYDFTITANSTGSTRLAYAIYLEEAEGNTIDPSLIHISLSRNGETLYEYEYERIYCYNYETNEIVFGSVGVGCDHINEYVASQILPYITTYETLGDGTMLRHIKYYTSNDRFECIHYTERQDSETGEWTMYGKGLTQNCDSDYGTRKSRMVNSFADIDSYDKYFSGQVDSIGSYAYQFGQTNLKNMLYVATMGTTNDVQTDTHTYQLRYWISEEELANQGTAEGTVNDDGSVSAEIGQDGVFKFKIAVSAKAISPS